MNWTNKTPTEPGWYWWRENLSYNGKIIWLSSSGRVLEILLTSPHTPESGQWYGPLQEPGGDAIENGYEPDAPLPDPPDEAFRSPEDPRWGK